MTEEFEQLVVPGDLTVVEDGLFFEKVTFFSDTVVCSDS